MKQSQARGVTVGRVGSGFSLIELLVVIAIIGIVIAILIPALRGARTASRVAATKATLSDLCKASDMFVSEKRRLPGYFSPAQMGAPSNATEGFTTMQNVLLDLSGGVTASSTPLQAGVVTDVGPGGGNTVRIDISKIGSGYFTATKALLATDNGLAANADNKLMPQVVDAFGMPVMAWIADTRPAQQFAAVDSSTPAKFYYNANAGVLNALTLGREQRRQQYIGTDPSSLIGGPDALRTMAALLGNKAYPQANSNPLAPADPRGTAVFHSAGADGYFVGRSDRGAKSQGTGSYVPYRTELDVMNDFDDVISATGN